MDGSELSTLLPWTLLLERIPFLSSFLTHTNNRKEINHVNYNRQSLEKDGYTISRMYVNGNLFGCNTLEDTDRGLLQDMQLEEIKKKRCMGRLQYHAAFMNAYIHILTDSRRCFHC